MSSALLFSNPSNKAFKLLLYQTKNKQWSTLRLRQISSSSLNFNNNPKTNESSSSSSSNNSQKSGGGSTGAKLVALTLAGFTVGIGYAVLNPDSRRQVESAIPQSTHLFNFIDGFLNSTPKPAPQSQSHDLPKIQKKEESLTANKPLEPLFKKPSEEAPKTVKQATPTQKAPVTQKQTETKAVAETKPAQSDNLDWKKTLKDFDLKEEAKIDAVENKLRTLNATVKLRVSEALNSSYVAIESLNKYKQALRAALDESDENGKETQWRQVTDFFDIQTSDVAEANQKILIAKTTLDELDTMIKELKSIEFSKNIRNLRETQTDMINQFRLLQAEQSKLSEAIVHANVLKNYTHEQKKARNQFLKEMQALQPEGIQAVNKTSGDQLSAEELNSLLIHAHKRVIQLQKQLEKTQSTQNQQIQAALEEQRRQSQEAAKSHDAMLHDLHKKEFALELEKTLEQQRAVAAEDLKKELARQAAAHNNHLAQMLRIQQEELNSLYEKRLIVETERIKSEFYTKVADSLGRLKGIEHAMNARANLELQANNAKQLWLAVQNLGELIQSKADEINSDNSELISLKANIQKIKEAAPDNEFIQTVLASVPEKVLARGIWSEPDLKERFQRLKTICNRVALIDDRGGSLFKYFISYVQSFFILHSKVDKSKLEQAAEHGKGPNLDDLVLNTFNILDYAEFYLKQDNLEYALRLMQQLKGEPHRLAKDWISEALVLLEIKQACNLLTAYISSVYIGTKFK